MAVATKSVTAAMSTFVSAGAPPSSARQRAAIAACDTVGVMLAGAPEPAPTIARAVVGASVQGPCRILGTSASASAADAAFLNGVAAHANVHTTANGSPRRRRSCERNDDREPYRSNHFSLLRRTCCTRRTSRTPRTLHWSHRIGSRQL
jgi:hypothetical protein